MQRIIDNLRINIGLQTCVTLLSGKRLYRTNIANDIKVGYKSYNFKNDMRDREDVLNLQTQVNVSNNPIRQYHQTFIGVRRTLMDSLQKIKQSKAGIQSF